jgi:protein TonB
MMAANSLRREERIGLLVALALHAALVAALLLQPDHHAAFPMPERMVVSLSRDVALESTAPNPAQDSQAAIAPTLSPEPALAPEPEPVVQPRKVVPPTPPKPVAKPLAKAPPKPTPKPRSTPVRDPISQQIERPSSRTAPASKTPAKPVDKKGGGARIGNDFLKGATSGERNENAALPASAIGAAERSSLAQAIARQLKPRWSAPQGADAELLVTVLSFELNPDGSLAGPPRVVSQDGITPANRTQAGRHAEQAIRAVQLAAPFDLPEKYFNVWKRISAFRFDRKLSQ